MIRVLSSLRVTRKGNTSCQGREMPVQLCRDSGYPQGCRLEISIFILAFASTKQLEAQLILLSLNLGQLLSKSVYFLLLFFSFAHDFMTG